MRFDDEPTAPVSIVPLRRARWAPGRTSLVVAIVVLLLAGVSVLAWPVVFRPAVSPASGGEVYRESTSDPGRDPFSGTVVVGNPPGTKSQTPIGTPGDTIPTISGDVPALYGGSRNEHVCDRQKLIAFLDDNPDKAAAWAGVLGIDPADIATYIGTLTPLQLRADTRVTNHGFVDGHATSLQSVLQAGTAVLVDDHGRPRVKCGCGNPLLEPVATPVTPVYTGDDWPDFNPHNVSAVSSAGSQVSRFVVYDLRTGDTFYRPRGTDGDQDEPTTPTPMPTPMPTTPMPTPSVVTCPSDTHLSGTTCVANAPPRCPDGQVRSGGRCVPTRISCPDGSHASDNNTSCVRDAPRCPDGTHLTDNGRCVDNTPSCDSGTHLKDGTCVPDVDPTLDSCPPGKHLVNDDTSCAPCPPGTHSVSDGTACAPDPCPPTCTVSTGADHLRPEPVSNQHPSTAATTTCAPTETCPPGTHHVTAKQLRRNPPPRLPTRHPPRHRPTAAPTTHRRPAHPAPTTSPADRVRATVRAPVPGRDRPRRPRCRQSKPTTPKQTVQRSAVPGAGRQRGWIRSDETPAPRASRRPRGCANRSTRQCVPLH